MNMNRRTLSTLDTRKLRDVVDRAERCWMTDVPHLDVIVDDLDVGEKAVLELGGSDPGRHGIGRRFPGGASRRLDRSAFRAAFCVRFFLERVAEVGDQRNRVRSSGTGSVMIILSTD